MCVGVFTRNGESTGDEVVIRTDMDTTGGYYIELCFSQGNEWGNTELSRIERQLTYRCRRWRRSPEVGDGRGVDRGLLEVGFEAVRNSAGTGARLRTFRLGGCWA